VTHTGADAELHVVTGAVGYSGRYIAQRLLDAGKRVRTLTNSPQRRNPFTRSITNPSLESALPYFRGKAQLEAALRETGLPHAILRPTVLFGKEDILITVAADIRG